MKIPILPRLLCFFFLALSFCACNDREPDSELSTICIDDYWKENPETFQRLISFEVNDETIYMFMSFCCDMLDEFYDAECNYICSTGGFTGAGDGLCPEWELSEDDFTLIYTR